MRASQPAARPRVLGGDGCHAQCAGARPTRATPGLFAGVALDGTVIAIDQAANESCYGICGVLASQILANKVANVPPAAQEFIAALTRVTSAPASKTAPAAPAVSPTPAVTPAPAPANEPAKTYPMEDPNPGAPPPRADIELSRRAVLRAALSIAEGNAR